MTKKEAGVTQNEAGSVPLEGEVIKGGNSSLKGEEIKGKGEGVIR
jgi:hypothetical protein